MDGKELIFEQCTSRQLVEIGRSINLQISEEAPHATAVQLLVQHDTNNRAYERAASLLFSPPTSPQPPPPPPTGGTVTQGNVPQQPPPPPGATPQRTVNPQASTITTTPAVAQHANRSISISSGPLTSQGFRNAPRTRSGNIDLFEYFAPQMLNAAASAIGSVIAATSDRHAEEREREQQRQRERQEQERLQREAERNRDPATGLQNTSSISRDLARGVSPASQLEAAHQMPPRTPDPRFLFETGHSASSSASAPRSSNGPPQPATSASSNSVTGRSVPSSSSSSRPRRDPLATVSNMLGSVAGTMETVASFMPENHANTYSNPLAREAASFRQSLNQAATQLRESAAMIPQLGTDGAENARLIREFLSSDPESATANIPENRRVIPLDPMQHDLDLMVKKCDLTEEHLCPVCYRSGDDFLEDHAPVSPTDSSDAASAANTSAPSSPPKEPQKDEKRANDCPYSSLKKMGCGRGRECTATYCLECLERWIRAQRSSVGTLQEVTCPNCRRFLARENASLARFINPARVEVQPRSSQSNSSRLSSRQDGCVQQ